MSDEKNTLNIAAPTPVATTSKAKLWQSRLLLIAACSVVVGGLLLQHVTKAKEEPHEEVATTSSTPMSAPELSPVQQQMNQINAAIEKQQPQQEPDRNQDDEAAEKLLKMRMVAPTTVFSTSAAAAQSQLAAAQNQKSGANAVLGGNGSGDANTEFMSRLSDSGVPVANATRMAHPATTLAQGTMIWATLETRIASDLPGMIRAVTSEDIYAEDGSQVLLPKGSRLVGQYTNAIAQGQKRVFVVWQRAIRPDHISIQINSPGTDALGAAGIGADTIDHHFFEQFGTAALLSIISAGAANIGVSSQDEFNSASAYREALSDSFAQTAQNTLKSTGMINPTLYIDQGKAISVFVSRDLDFYRVLHSGQA